MSTPIPLWIDMVRESTQRDPYFQDLHDRLGKGLLDPAKYVVHNGILWRKDRIMAGPNSLKNDNF